MTVLGIIFIVIGLALVFIRPRFKYVWGGPWRSYLAGPIVVILGILLIAGVLD